MVLERNTETVTGVCFQSEQREGTCTVKYAFHASKPTLTFWLIRGVEYYSLHLCAGLSVVLYTSVF